MCLTRSQMLFHRTSSLYGELVCVSTSVDSLPAALTPLYCHSMACPHLDLRAAMGYIHQLCYKCAHMYMYMNNMYLHAILCFSKLILVQLIQLSVEW